MLTYKNTVLICFTPPLTPFLIDISACLLTNVIVESISSKQLYLVKLKAICHITQQASTNTYFGSVPNLNSQALTRDKSLYTIFENKR